MAMTFRAQRMPSGRDSADSTASFPPSGDHETFMLPGAKPGILVSTCSLPPSDLATTIAFDTGASWGRIKMANTQRSYWLPIRLSTGNLRAFFHSGFP